MATGMAHSDDALKTIGRGESERWLFLANRSLFHRIGSEPSPQARVKLDDCHIPCSDTVTPGLRFPNVASGSLGGIDFYTGRRRDSTVEVCRSSALAGEVDR
jgi:hypothetical protein